ncbi:hypothetical protein L211DRAFT_777820 [Terfezia boudieri ATCC MYA-4762]|uniref:Uncharacterized protein n=1 Tax=Terfezia boudieri ATCC MYA-4762 TaxID=1051890 RepID=A0A3N4M049_9PEZI|nr:hypothetical protein L211DRAFT_777820 [Terfezia boudieri ATCC MYA-4762]
MHRKRHTHHLHHHAWVHKEEERSVEHIEHALPVNLGLRAFGTATEPDTAIIARRADSSTTCAPNDSSPQCEKPAATTSGSLPIILGSAIPIVIACIVLYFLHRRHMTRLRMEEIHDKTKSMDFGMGFGAGAGARKANAEKIGKGHKSNQLSMDLDLNNPYVLPGTLRGSRESLTSLGKGLDAGDPRYGLRPGTSHSQMGGLSPGAKSYAPSHHSNLAHAKTRESSIYTASIRNEDDSPNGSTTSMSDELLKKAQGMAMSSPPPPRSSTTPRIQTHAPELRIPSPPPAAVVRPASPSMRPGFPAALQPGSARDSSLNSHQIPPISTDMIPKLDFEFNLTVSAPPPVTKVEAPQIPEPVKAEVRPHSDASNYDDDVNNGIQFRFSTASENEVAEPALRKVSRDTLAPGAYDNRRLSMGFRPLPPDGTPDESAEERATRIRSFYKEYFDDSNGDGDRQSFYPPAGGYYEDITDAYMPSTYQDDSAPVYDHASGNFVVPGARPFAEPPTRRAMTPPPRIQHGYEGPRAGSSASNRMPPPGPRSFTSQGMHGPQPRGAPRRPMPPPAPLKNIPSPAHLGEDAFANPLAFAPRVKVQDIVTGRDSPSLRPGERSYSPQVPAHTPLASAFDDLPSLMAPYSLRKSGTFTGLDFAPPKKFKNDDGMGSDAGSVRSGRSQLNPQNINAIRAGAYRVSRIPQEVVPLKDDMAAHLKPTMDLSTRY